MICSQRKSFSANFVSSSSSHMIKISMVNFVKQFQPIKYNDWIEGRDIGVHPEQSVTEAAAGPIRSQSEQEDNILIKTKYVIGFVVS